MNYSTNNYICKINYTDGNRKIGLYGLGVREFGGLCWALTHTHNRKDDVVDLHLITRDSPVKVLNKDEILGKAKEYVDWYNKKSDHDKIIFCGNDGGGDP